MYEEYIKTEGRKITLNLNNQNTLNIDESFKTVKENSVNHLNLGSNRITPEEATAIATLLKENDTLTHLDLLWNRIGNEGAEAIADALKLNNTLTHLYLTWNNIGSEGGIQIAEVLKENITLTHIELYHNSIEPEGLNAIANALEKNNTLTYLDVSCNGIGDPEADRIAKALKENDTLSNLDISYNGIENAGAEAITKSLESNHSLINVDLSKNNISDNTLFDKIKLITERNNKDLTEIAKCFLANKELILNNNLFKIFDLNNKEYSNLRVAIKKSFSVSASLIEQLLTEKIEGVEIAKPISNEDAKKLVKNVNSFVDNNLFQLAQSLTPLPYVPLQNIVSWMTRPEKYKLFTELFTKEKPQDNDVTDTTNLSQESRIEDNDTTTNLIGKIQETEDQ